MQPSVGVVVPPAELAAAVTRSPQRSGQVPFGELFWKVPEIAAGRQLREPQPRVLVDSRDAGIGQRLAKALPHPPLILRRGCGKLRHVETVAPLADLEAFQVADSLLRG